MQDSRKALLSLIVFILIALSPLSGLAIIFAIVCLVYERKKGRNGIFLVQWHTTKEALRQYWWLIFLPAAVAMGQVIFAHFTIPAFNEHVMNRVEPMLHLSSLLILIPQLLVLAFGEELAFRGFAQEKLSTLIDARIAIIVISLIFSVAHITAGPAGVVIYDLTFIFINSILYGVLFLKTKNVYLTTVAHFFANVASIYIFNVM